MMLTGDSGASPSDLQAAILKGLLAGTSKPVETSIDLLQLAKLMIPALQVALGAERNMTPVKQSTMTLGDCLRSMGEPCVPFIFAMDDDNKNPSLILLPHSLVTMLLTLELGGQGAVAKPANSAPLSRIEGRFASQLLPQLEIAIVPLLSGPIKRTHIAGKDAEALALNLPEAMAHIFSYTLQLGDLTYALAVAINCEAIVPSPLQKAQLMSAQPRRNDVAAEIGRTRIEVEVLFKLGDQTLERLHALKAGDVIPISGSNFNEAKMRVRGHDLFEGHIGKSGLSYSFKVARHTRKQTGGMSQMVKTLTERGHNI